MDLSIIIVNWNSKDYLHKCIASILSNTKLIDFEIVVIDNGSLDGCAEMLKEVYPQVEFIQSVENLGFAKANNLAFHISKGECLLFLNPDTEVCESSIEIMYQSLQSLPDAGTVGCKLLNSDLSLQTSCIQSFPTLLNQLLDFQVLRQHFPHSRLWGTAALFDNSKTPSKVDAVSGACLMLRRSVFEAVGLFTTDYFMYSEDIDLSFKLKQSGFENFYIPSAVVIHHGGGSSDKSEVSTFSCTMMVESNWRFFVRHRSRFYGLLYRISMMLASGLRIVMAVVVMPAFLSKRNNASSQAILNKWHARLKWTLGLENWVNRF